MGAKGGSSPVLAIACPQCAAEPGAYCKRPNGETQVIAHKVRKMAFYTCASCGHQAYHCLAGGCNYTMPDGEWCECEAFVTGGEVVLLPVRP
jgi:hypothetical protein